MAKFIYYVNNNYNGKCYIKPHFHRNYEIVYNVFGNSTTKIIHASSNNIIRELGPTLFVSDSFDSNLVKVGLEEHSFIIYPPYYTHDEFHENPGKVIAINFSLDTDENIIPLTTCIDKDEEIKEIFDKIAFEMDEKKANYQQMINAYLTMIVALVKRKYLTNDDDVDFMNQIVKQVDDYFASKIDFDELAKSYGYNSDYLRALFKKKTGLSPKNYIQKKRIDLAIRLIEETDSPLKNISTSCGYTDYLQFTSYFKKKTGYSPYEYRKLKRKK